MTPTTERRGGSGCRYRTIGPKAGGNAEWPLPFRPLTRPIPRFSVVRIRDRRHLGAAVEDSSVPGRAGDGSDRFLRSRLVAEVGPQPSLGLRRRDALAACVVLDLVAVDSPHREVARLRMREV